MSAEFRNCRAVILARGTPVHLELGIKMSRKDAFEVATTVSGLPWVKGLVFIEDVNWPATKPLECPRCDTRVGTPLDLSILA